MRAAPAGMAGIGNSGTVFATGRDPAALARGHPTGILTAGVFAATIAGILCHGRELPRR